MLARRKKILSLIGAERIVVVLARAVHPIKRLLVQQAGQAVLFGHDLHRLHHQMVGVTGQIG